MPLDWMEISIDTTHKGLENVCARLSMLGIDSLCVQDETEFQDFIEKTIPAWESVTSELRELLRGLCRITFYLPFDGDILLEDVRKALISLPNDCPGTPFGLLDPRVRTVQEEDWAENWKQYYKPVYVGNRLLVQPAWKPLTKMEERTVFLNNPGMSFGTGEHETTLMCLEKIERLITGGERVLDVGCGSGILSICALLLGAAEADAVDIDPLAVATANQNAQINGLDRRRYRAALGNLLQTESAQAWPGPYQMILANIVTDVIVALCPLFSDRLAAGGVLVISGVIELKREEILRALTKANLCMEEEVSLRGWCCFTARKFS